MPARPPRRDDGPPRRVADILSLGGLQEGNDPQQRYRPRERRDGESLQVYLASPAVHQSLLRLVPLSKDAAGRQKVAGPAWDWRDASAPAGATALDQGRPEPPGQGPGCLRRAGIGRGKVAHGVGFLRAWAQSVAPRLRGSDRRIKEPFHESRRRPETDCCTTASDRIIGDMPLDHGGHASEGPQRHGPIDVALSTAANPAGARRRNAA